MVSRLSPEKNIKYALDLVKDLEKISLVVIGSGPREALLKQYVKEKNIDNVLFLGYKDNVYDFYNIFDAFLLTSKMEGTPISILEAMSCGLPIYSTDVGEIRDNFAHLEGFSLLTGDTEADRDIISAQADLPNYIQCLRDHVVSNHNIKIISNKFFDNIVSNFQTFKESDEEAVTLFGEYI